MDCGPTTKDTHLSIELTDTQVLDIGLDDPQGVGVTHTTLPALDNDNGVVLGQDVQLHGLGNTPLDTAVDILLPVNLGEIGLRLVEVEGVHATVQMAVPGGAGIPGHHEDGAHRPVLGDQAGRLARGGQNDDTTSVEIQGRADGGHGARLDHADGALDQSAQLLEVGDVWDGVLGLQASYKGKRWVSDDYSAWASWDLSKLTLAHLVDGLFRVRTLGSLAGQHHAVSTVSNGVANVANLGTGWPGVLDHALEHLSGADDWLSGHVAHGDHLLLGSEHLSGGNLDTQVTTGNHDTVGGLENLAEVVETLPVLNLGNDLDVLALLAEDLPDGLNILSPSDERGEDHVDVVLDTKPQVVLVLLGQSRKIDIGVGQVDTLLGRDEAVVLALDADGLVVNNLEDLERQDTVIDVDDTALLDNLGDVLVVDVHVLGVTCRLVFLIGGDVHHGTSRDGEISVACGVASSDFLLSLV